MKVLGKRVPLLALPLAALAACATPTPYQPLTTQGAAHPKAADNPRAFDARQILSNLGPRIATPS